MHKLDIGKHMVGRWEKYGEALFGIYSPYYLIYIIDLKFFSFLCSQILPIGCNSLSPNEAEAQIPSKHSYVESHVLLTESGMQNKFICCSLSITFSPLVCCQVLVSEINVETAEWIGCAPLFSYVWGELNMFIWERQCLSSRLRGISASNKWKCR